MILPSLYTIGHISLTMISDAKQIIEQKTIDEMGANSLAQYQPLNFSSFRDKLSSRSLSMRSGSMDRLLELNFKNVPANGFEYEKKKLIQLAEFARLSRVQIKFDGLTKLQAKYTPHNCCTWFSGHEYHPECDLIQLLSAIQSQSESSPRKYNIELIY